MFTDAIPESQTLYKFLLALIDVADDFQSGLQNYAKSCKNTHLQTECFLSHIQAHRKYRMVQVCALQGNWCTASCVVHMNSGDESICLWPITFGMK
jgi:hypothetical protein